MMAILEFIIDCAEHAQRMELLDKLASLGGYGIHVDEIMGLGMEYVGPEINPQEKKVCTASVEACLLKSGFMEKTKQDEGVRRFAKPQSATEYVAEKDAVSETAEGDMMDQGTLIDEDERILHKSLEFRIGRENRVAQQNRIAQEILDTQQDWISRGYPEDISPLRVCLRRLTR
ncbi:hypothetical protein J3F83DRAFT_753142 [Trichoderma novae-zelandiae]